MAEAGEQGKLFGEDEGPADVAVVNDRCAVRTQRGHRLVLVAGVPLAQYAVGDRMAEAHAMVSLVEQGWAEQDDVARAFGYSARTVRRYARRFAAGGLAALGRRGGYPRGRPRVRTSRLCLVGKLKREGVADHVDPSIMVSTRIGGASRRPREARAR
jgi:hypothetical protein